jgi:hypothetical protein
MDSCASRRSRLICSNSSTLDRAIPDLHADGIDVQIRTGVGPTFVTTRCTHHQRDHHPGWWGQNS